MEESRAVKGESLAKRQTRSVHEKQRRMEMNEVIWNMMSLLPYRDISEKRNAKKPDKCCIIGNAVRFIRCATRRSARAAAIRDETVLDSLRLADALVVGLEELRIVSVDGDSLGSFGLDSSRMIGKDMRWFFDFQSVSAFSIRDTTAPRLIKSLSGKLLNYTMKVSQVCFEKVSRLPLRNEIRVAVGSYWCEDKWPVYANKRNLKNKLESVVVFTPTLLPYDFPPPCKTPMTMADERPILAAMLRKTEPLEDSILVNTTPIASLHCETASTTSSSFLSPQSTSSVGGEIKGSCRKNSKKKVPSSRKRLRSVNVIVESYSLDDASKKVQVIEHRDSSQSSATISSVPILAHPDPVNPYDVLAPGYQEILLRLQSERLLLEERVMAKKRELQGLMFTSIASYPSDSSQIPQYYPNAVPDVVTTQTL